MGGCTRKAHARHNMYIKYIHTSKNNVIDISAIIIQIIILIIIKTVTKSIVKPSNEQLRPFTKIRCPINILSPTPINALEECHSVLQLFLYFPLLSHYHHHYHRYHPHNNHHIGEHISSYFFFYQTSIFPSSRLLYL